MKSPIGVHINAPPILLLCFQARGESVFLTGFNQVNGYNINRVNDSIADNYELNLDLASLKPTKSGRGDDRPSPVNDTGRKFFFEVV